MGPNNSQDTNNKSLSNGSTNKPAIHAISTISFFSKDKRFAFAHQKIEKLVAALYLLTGDWETGEPLKVSLRNLGVDILQLHIDLKGSKASHGGSADLTLKARVLEIESLLEVASMSGLISEMNFAILRREFHGLLTYMERSEQRTGLPAIFKEDSLSVPEISTPVRRGEDDADVSMSHSIVTEPSSQPVSHQTHIKDKNQKNLKEYGPVAVKKNKRQSIIINLLKRKKEIMVKDVSEIVHDCSEKTLQRELSDLVFQGVLKKEGERRWTRYSLAQ